MFNSIVKKSMLCVLFAGLVLAVQPVNAMNGKGAQASGGSSWLKIGAVVVVGYLAGIYVWCKYEQSKKNQQIFKNNKLLEAVASGVLADVKHWIDQGADVRVCDNRELAYRSSLPIFKYLIAHPDIDLNKISDGQSLLMWILEAVGKVKFRK